MHIKKTKMTKICNNIPVPIHRFKQPVFEKKTKSPSTHIYASGYIYNKVYYFRFTFSLIYQFIINILTKSQIMY